MFQGINFTVQQIWILAWCFKGKTLLDFVNKLFISVQLIFFLGHVLLLAELVQKFKFFKIAVWQSDSMKRNFGTFIFMWILKLSCNIYENPDSTSYRFWTHCGKSVVPISSMNDSPHNQSSKRNEGSSTPILKLSFWERIGNGYWK